MSTTTDSRFAEALADYAGSMRARVLFAISAIALSVTHVMYGVTISGYYALAVIAALVSLGGMFLCAEFKQRGNGIPRLCQTVEHLTIGHSQNLRSPPARATHALATAARTQLTKASASTA